MKIRRGLTAAVIAGMMGAMTVASGISAYAATGWVQSGSTYVYYDSDGSLHKGWVNTADGYYYTDLSSGQMVTGWQQINNNWYYFQADGLMATGWVQDGGKNYYPADRSGPCATRAGSTSALIITTWAPTALWSLAGSRLTAASSTLIRATASVQ